MKNSLRRYLYISLAIAYLLLGKASTSASASPSLGNAASTSQQSSPIIFAAIGDYGNAGQAEADVAALVNSWNPDFIITLGDNNYPGGDASTIDTNIGQYYHSYIFPYTGSYGTGASTNKFFPALGNHDWATTNAQPFFDYFTLPGNERYYDFVKGPIHFFILDSDPHEPDGNTDISAQAAWLRNGLTTSTSVFNVVVAHHAPYSSGPHGSNENMQWPFRAWGADVVMAGHDHTYERLSIDNVTYFVNGLGGKSIYAFNEPVPGSQVRYNQDYGAMRMEATETSLLFQFYSRTGQLEDTYTLVRSPVFNDVSETHWAYSFIETLYFNGVTSGCSSIPKLYCPNRSVTRAEMAIFLLRGIHGADYIPPAAKGDVFADVSGTIWAADWIEQLRAEGITNGCGGSNYCPNRAVTRAEMAIFLLRANHSASYTPDPATGVIFNDVSATTWAAAWIEQLKAEGITSGCGNGNYCPNRSVTRAEMAIFLTRTFNLTMP